MQGIRTIVSAIAAALLAGCASFPPAKLVDGSYFDAEHALQFRLPAGWSQSDILPARFRPSDRATRMGYAMYAQKSITERKLHYPHEYNNRTGEPYVCVFGQYADAIFVSPDGSAAITLSTTPFSANLRTFTQQEIHKGLAALYAHEQHMAALTSSTRGYTYTVEPRPLTEEPTYLARSGFEIRQAETTYPCEMLLYCASKGDISYAVRLALISENSVFEENLILLEQVAATLKRYAPDASQPAAAK